MATTPETQAYISLAVSLGAQRAATKAGVTVTLAQLGAWQQSIALQITRLNAAFTAEQDPQIRQHLEHERQTLLAMRREVSEVEQQVTDLPPLLVQQERYQAAFATDAVAKGYLLA